MLNPCKITNYYIRYCRITEQKKRASRRMPERKYLRTSFREMLREKIQACLISVNSEISLLIVTRS